MNEQTPRQISTAQRSQIGEANNSSVEQIDSSVRQPNNMNLRSLAKDSLYDEDAMDQQYDVGQTLQSKEEAKVGEM